MADVAGLLDTSVLISPAPPEERPERAAISAMSLAELHLGVLRARTGEQRAMRLRRLAVIESRLDALPIDDDVARSYGMLVAAARDQGRRPQVADALIAATAIAHDLPLYTRDADFDGLPGLTVVRV